MTKSKLPLNFEIALEAKPRPVESLFRDGLVHMNDIYPNLLRISVRLTRIVLHARDV